MFTIVTTASRISPLNGLKTTHWYLTGNVTNPVPSRISPFPMFSIPVTATTNPCRPLQSGWKSKCYILWMPNQITKLLSLRWCYWKRLRGITCKCLPHLSLAWKRDYHEGCDQSSVDAAAYFAPALCGKTFLCFSFFPPFLPNLDSHSGPQNTKEEKIKRIKWEKLSHIITREPTNGEPNGVYVQYSSIQFQTELQRLLH